MNDIIVAEGRAPERDFYPYPHASCYRTNLGYVSRSVPTIESQINEVVMAGKRVSYGVSHMGYTWDWEERVENYELD